MDNNAMAAAAADHLQVNPVDVPMRFEAIGLLSYAGIMEKVTITLPFAEVAERLDFDRLLDRHDFGLDRTTMQTQPDLNEKHADRIATSLIGNERPHLGTLTVAIGHDQVQIKKLQAIARNAWLVKASLPGTSLNPVIEDGLHRFRALASAWRTLAKASDDGPTRKARETLGRSSVELTLLLEDDPEVLSSLFVQMGQTRPISASLTAVLDRSTMQNALGQKVARKSRAFATREGEALYPLASIRSAVASAAGVGVRDRTPDQRESVLASILGERAANSGQSREQALDDLSGEIAELFDHAFSSIPGWAEVTVGRISLQEFRRDYVHSAVSGLHTVANVIACARLAGVDSHLVVDELARLPWRLDDIGKVSRGGEDVCEHVLFEGSLVSTGRDETTGTWKAHRAGAARLSYEGASRAALASIARRSKELAALNEPHVLKALGLKKSGRGPGRPRKNAVEEQSRLNAVWLPPLSGGGRSAGS